MRSPFVSVRLATAGILGKSAMVKTEWTVRVIPIPDWRSDVDRPVWHFLVKAKSAAEAEARMWETRHPLNAMIRQVPDGAEVTAFPRFM
jgi:hypothetical protein